LIQELGGELGNLMAEKDDLYIDFKNHIPAHDINGMTCDIHQSLTDSQPTENGSPILTIQGQELPYSTWGRSFPGITAPILQIPMKGS
jgi:hypothetical protein